MKKIVNCAALCLVAMACQKNIDTAASGFQSLRSPFEIPPVIPVSTGNVYVAGDVFWKNGVTTSLPGSSSEYVSNNNDVYVA